MKDLFKKLCIVTTVFIAIFLIVSQESFADQKFKLKQDSEDWLTVKLKGETWSAASPNLTLSVKQKGDKIKLTISSAEYVAKLKEEKIKIYNPDESLRLIIKKSSEKIKILQSEDDPNPWSLKLKDDGQSYKVSKGEQEIGKVKFYPDKSKIKTKDPDEREFCSIKTDKLLPGAAVCLFNGLSEEDQLILFTLLMMEYH